MKVLYLNHNPVWSGTFHRAWHLARPLAARGHQVTVVTTRRSGRWRFRSWEADGVRVLEAPDLFSGAARTGWDGYNTARRIGALWREEFDLIHAFDSRPAVVLPALALRRRTGALLVMDWADWWGRGGRIQERPSRIVAATFGPVETWFEEAFRLQARAATVISRALERRLVALGFPAERVLRLPNGCHAEPPVPDRAVARRELGMAGGGALLVHVGVILQQDLELLLAALAEIPPEQGPVRLAMVGNCQARLPAELVRSGQVIATGFVSAEELRRWLGAADLCVLPMLDTVGHRGRWPSKLSDYMAAGRATVVTRVGEAAELVEERGLGWTAAPTRAALGAALAGALGAPAERAAAGARARACATTELAWTTVAARLEAFYGAAAGPGTAAGSGSEVTIAAEPDRD
jgi:glycosyltransferase involved in cell wall biosynthesis